MTTKIQRNTGFTLIELMIVVAIIGIIAFYAYPSYQEFVIKTRNPEGKTFLEHIMHQQRVHYGENSTFTENLGDLGYTLVDETSTESAHGYYSVTAGLCDEVDASITTCVLLTATAQGVQAADGVLTLNSRNELRHIHIDGRVTDWAGFEIAEE